MNKDQIFELRIEEDDDISGVDQISLVDEPAIEVNWIAFNKEKLHNFDIPDGEDEKYVNMLAEKAENEQDLFDQGWVVDSIEVDDKLSFVTTPNATSEWDEPEYLVRYKYMLNPSIHGQGPIIPTTRHFCSNLINKNYVWRVEEMDNLTNQFGQPAIVWRGGYNCRHVWGKIRYKKDATIINKASINKGKIDVGGFPSGLAPELDVLGYQQPSTITEKTLNNPSKSTIRNLGLAKEKFDGEKVSMDYDDTLSTDRGKELAKRLISEGKDLYIITRRQESALGPVLKVAEDLGIAKDKVHATNGKLKWETIKRLGIQTHYDNNPDEIKAIKDNLQGIRGIQFDYNVGGITGYVDPGIAKKKKPLTESYLDNFEYLQSKEQMSKQKFQFDEDKRIVLGPAMIPDLKIFRRDKSGNPYYVFFSADTIKMIAEKYMKNKYIDNNDMMHEGDAVKDVYVYESWIKEDAEDKANKYGYGDLPIGTWFVSMKVKNDEVWNKIKTGELNGFSVSGYFEEVAEFSMEEIFLDRVARILKQVE